MTNQPATQPHGQEGMIIPGRRESVTALCVHTFLAILAGLALRMVFVHWFPTTTDDSTTYLQLASNWVDHHVYGLSQNGQLVPTDLRTPGYPAFLAGVTLLIRRSIQAIMLSQAVLDVITCVLTAALARALAPAGARRHVWIVALWLAATCPFVANYSAVVLTEVVVTFLATAALACFALGLRQEPTQLGLRVARQWNLPFAFALLGAVLTGAATLVRPEMPLLLGVAVLVYGLRAWRALGAQKAVLFAAAMVGAFLLPLLPWAARNAISLNKLQFLAPRYATFPDEYAPVGYYAWTGTWLERFRDAYLTVWEIGEDRTDVNDLPASAFDSPEEKARVADLIAQYNDSPDLDISPRNGSPICRNRPRADAAPPAANVRPRAVRTRLDDLVHAADRVVAHRRQILASPRTMGRFPRRRTRHGRVCGVGVPVRGVSDRRNLAGLAHTPGKRRHRSTCWGESLGDCPAARVLSGSNGISDHYRSPRTSLRRVVLSGSSRLNCIARNWKKEAQGSNIRFERIKIVW